MLKFTVLLASVLIVAIAENDVELNVEDFVSKINNAQNLWKAAPNEVTGKGFAYMKRLLGTKLPESNRVINLPVESDVANDIPESFDARKQWPKCASISSVKDQGNCGSCWAVAAAACAADRLCIQSKFKRRFNISAENLLCCCSDCVDPGTQGCDGGYPEKAWDYFMKSGLVTGGDYGSKEGCQPYEIAPSGDEENDADNEYTPPCYKKCTNKKYGRSFRKDKHFGKTSYLLDNSTTAIQTDIMKYGPVEAAFTVYLDFMYYTSGIYTRTSSTKMGGHAVRVIGWGVEKGVKYWLVANSWNRSWGENGLFRIKRGTNECGFEEYVTAGRVKK